MTETKSSVSVDVHRVERVSVNIHDSGAAVVRHGAFPVQVNVYYANSFEAARAALDVLMNIPGVVRMETLEDVAWDIQSAEQFLRSVAS